MGDTCSVVIPTYNSAQTLRRAIQSVMSQETGPHEIIIVDDGSTDNTPETVKQFSDRIIYLYQENRGVSAARNAGLRKASAGWVAYLDADDEMLPKALAALLSAARKATACDVVASDFWHVSPDGTLIDRASERHRAGMDQVLWLRKRDLWIAQDHLVEGLLARFFISPSTAIIRRRVFADCGGWNEDYRTSEDLDLFIRLAMGGVSFAYVPEPLYLIHQTPESLCRGNDQVVADRLKVLANLELLALSVSQKRAISRAMGLCELDLAWQARRKGLHKQSRAHAMAAFLRGYPLKGAYAFLRSIIPF